MTIVSFEDNSVSNNISWEEQKAKLATMPIVPDSQIDFSDIPPMTKDQLVQMKLGAIARAEWRAKNKQKIAVS